MRRRKRENPCRKTMFTLELLDDRTLLSLAPTSALMAAAPVAQPAAAASPIDAALVGRYEAAIERLANKYSAQAHRLDNLLSSRLANLNHKLTTAMTRDQAMIASATSSSATCRRPVIRV